jgi:hypothetical protein
MSRALASLLFVFVAVPAFGQIIYEPAQYQYSCAGQSYYYGGSNPAIIDFANRHALTEYYRPTPFGGYTFRQHVPIYTDLLPYRDVAVYGFNPDFAANESANNTLVYFRKRDLLRLARQAADGTIVVPSKGPSEGYVDYACPDMKDHATYYPLGRYPATHPSTMPRRGEIIIIPKRLLDRPLKSFEPREKSVASAN